MAGRKYEAAETNKAIMQGDLLASVLRPAQKQRLLAVLMAKIILDDGHDLLSALIERVQKTVR